jgi:hypothetical protein
MRSLSVFVYRLPDRFTQTYLFLYFLYQSYRSLNFLVWTSQSEHKQQTDTMSLVCRLNSATRL